MQFNSQSSQISLSTIADNAAQVAFDVMFATNGRGVIYNDLDEEVSKCSSIVASLKHYISLLEDGSFHRLSYSYSTKAPRPNFGRQYDVVGLQFLPKPVRNLVFGSTHVDVDLVNCHPTLLWNLMGRPASGPLHDYVANRDYFLRYHGVTKTDVLTTLYESRHVACEALNDLHKEIWTWWSDTIGSVYTQKEMDSIQFPQLPKTKKDADDESSESGSSASSSRSSSPGPENVNWRASALSWYLQDVERQCLSTIISSLRGSDWQVDLELFDGCLVRRRPGLSIGHDLRLAEEAVERELDYKIKLDVKEMRSMWTPDIPDLSQLDHSMACRIACHSFYEPPMVGKKRQREVYLSAVGRVLCQYLNQFIGRVAGGGWVMRDDTTQKFAVTDHASIKMLLGNIYGGKKLMLIDLFRPADGARTFKRVDFIVDKDDPDYDNPLVINRYERPVFANEAPDDAWFRSTPVFKYLVDCLVNDNMDTAEDKVAMVDMLVALLAESLLKGKTNVAVALYGRAQGTGKSSFARLVAALHGDMHGTRLVNIWSKSEDISATFNGGLADKVVTVAEELPVGAGMNRALQGQIKELITSETLLINEKYQKPRLVKNNLLVCFATNDEMPVALDGDDRRFIVLRVTAAAFESVQVMSNWLSSVFHPWLDEERNLQLLRAYLATKRNPRLLRNRELMCRSSGHADIVDVSQSPVIDFVAEFLEPALRGVESGTEEFNEFIYDTSVGFAADKARVLKGSAIFRHYRIWCNRNGFSRPKNSRWFWRQINGMPGLAECGSYKVDGNTVRGFKCDKPE